MEERGWKRISCLSCPFPTTVTWVSVLLAVTPGTFVSKGRSAYLFRKSIFVFSDSGLFIVEGIHLPLSGVSHQAEGGLYFKGSKDK